MVSTLLRTKLFAPAVDPNTVVRLRLLRRLGAARRGQVVLVSAPAGSGKTTLVSSWLAQEGGKVGWLSIDEDDDNPHHFLTYLVSALRSMRPDLGSTALGLLQVAPPVAADTVVRALLNDLAGREEVGVLVLDDYHAVEHEEIHRAMGVLTRRLPPGLTLVIVTRIDPALPLARLRATGNLVEIRASDLRFQTDEAATLIERVGQLRLEEEAVSALTHRVEGWAVGLQLAGLAMRRTSDPHEFISRFTGTHEYVADYLADEVLGRLSREQQDFLVKASVLKRLNGSICDAVTGGTDGHTQLEALSRANLFLIPLDESRTWFRFHHLFGDLLRRRCRERYRSQYHIYLERASDWSERHGLWEEALSYSYEAGNTGRLAVLLARYGLQLLSAGKAETALKWLRVLPGDLVSRRADTCLIAAYAHNLIQDFDRFTYYTRTGLSHLAEGVPEPCEIPGIEGHLRLLEAGMAFLEGVAPRTIRAMLERVYLELCGDDVLLRSVAELMLGHAHVQEESYEGAAESYRKCRETSIEASSLIMELLASAALAEAYVYAGAFDRCRAVVEATLDRIASAAGVVVNIEMATLEALRGLAQFEHGEDEVANESMRRSLKLFEALSAEQAAHFSIAEMARTPSSILHSTSSRIIVCLTAHVRLLLYGGRLHEAARQIEAADRSLHPVAREIGDVALDVLRVRLWCAANDATALQNWLRVCTEPRAVSVYWNALWHLARVRALIKTADHVEAARVLETLIGPLSETCVGGHSETSHHPPAETPHAALSDMSLGALSDTPHAMLSNISLEGCRQEAHMLAGVVLHRIGKLEDATAHASRAVELSSANGSIAPWCEAADLTLPLLREVVASASTATAVSNHAATLIDVVVRRQESPVAAVQDALTERELEVLRLLAAGRKNREIADELYLAVGTVKKHTHTIYQKLDVSNRTQALRRAQDLRLL